MISLASFKESDALYYHQARQTQTMSRINCFHNTQGDHDVQQDPPNETLNISTTMEDPYASHNYVILTNASASPSHKHLHLGNI